MPGSIPACAGEPRVVVRPVNPPRVYPRVCGGTNSNPRWGSTDRGLSPRVRGNRGVGRTGDLPSGSIPACAGEPSNADALATTARVYPRVCGGTSPAPSAFRAGVGLSPRVRGNRRRNEPAPESEGSIPACAGEPVVSMRRRGGTAVYPRVCGGTPAGVFLPANCPGLSPRVRGNRPPSASTYRHGRSIPACAGEPAVARRRLCPRKVYPRVCGGTGPRRAADDAVIGLSPRVRGNHAAATLPPAP